MIAKSYIMYNLKYIDRKYNSASNHKESLLMSKLAIIELCGWIEESMDDIVLRTAKKWVKDPNNMKMVEKDIVKRTHGFDYVENFRPMLIRIIGLINVERLEKSVDHVKFNRLKSLLPNLKTARNAEAHTHIKGITRTINSPSITISQFPPVYEGLIEIDRVLRSIII